MPALGTNLAMGTCVPQAKQDWVYGDSSRLSGDNHKLEHKLRKG